MVLEYGLPWRADEMIGRVDEGEHLRGQVSLIAESSANDDID